MDKEKSKFCFFGCFTYKSEIGCEISLPKIIGEQCEKIYDTIMENHRVHLINIHGPMGVGKTTVLAYLNNRFLKERYDFVIFLSGLRLLTLSVLVAEIAKLIGLSDTPGWNQKGIHQKSQDIRDLFSQKSCAILIDDLCDFNVESFPFRSCQNYWSKVVVVNHTFRYNDHTSISVMPLLWEDAWRLFKQEIGDVRPEFSTVAAQVALLCHGLPDALVKIARLMKCNTTLEEWENAIEILKKCDKRVSGGIGSNDLAQILCDELGRNNVFKERVVAQIMPETTTSYDHDRFCKIGRDLGELKDTLAKISDTDRKNKDIKKQSLEIVDRLSSYASLN